MKTKKKSILESNILYTLIAIVVGFIIGAIFLSFAGISASAAYGKQNATKSDTLLRLRR